jgi:nucleoside-diphosphate-sugar epimerase
MAAMKFTVLGSSGFIGGHMVKYLQAQGHEVDAPPLGADLKNVKLGHVINATGVVGGNAKEMQSSMLETHVMLTQHLLKNTNFKSLLYISSTRFYGPLKGIKVSEDMPLPFTPSGWAVFDVSKLLGECICLSFDDPRIRIVRPSNIYGTGMNPRTFLGAVLRDLKEKGTVTINESPQSSKDYISIDDAMKLFENIALNGKERLYNVASGTITTHQQIADMLRKFGEIKFADNGTTRVFPPIDTSRVSKEFGMTYRNLLDDLPGLI